MPNTPYKWLAKNYDEFFSFHLNWFESARREILGDIATRAESVCDLACGTGTTAIQFARRGVKAYGVDLSPAMCRLARAKAKKQRVELTVVNGDMRTFALPEKVDLLLCEFDALNHVDRKRDLPQVLKRVSRALKPGGYFFFDVNNRLAFDKIWSGCWFVDRPKVSMVMRGGYDGEREKGWIQVDAFTRKTRGLWARESERIEQVCWTAREMRTALRDAGLPAIRAFDATPFFAGDPQIAPGCRTFYLARKKTA